jgi:hypothetical protein
MTILERRLFQIEKKLRLEPRRQISSHRELPVLYNQ